MNSTDEETMKPTGGSFDNDSTVSACSSVMSASWTCVVCKFQNCDPKFEKCAMCGSREANTNYLEDHRFRLQVKRQRRHGGRGNGITMNNHRRLVATTAQNPTTTARQEAVSSTATSDTSFPSVCEDVQEQSKTTRPPSSWPPDLPRSPSSKSSPKAISKSNAINEEGDDETLVQSGLNNTGIFGIFRPQTTHRKDCNRTNNNIDPRKSVISDRKPASRPNPPTSTLTFTSISTQQVEPNLGIRKPRHDSFDDEVIPPAPNHRPPKSPTRRCQHQQKRTSTTIKKSSSNNNDGINKDKFVSIHSSPRRLNALDTATSTSIETTSETTESIRGSSHTGSDDDSTVTSSIVADRYGTVNNMTARMKDTKQEETNKDKQDHKMVFEGSASSLSSIDAIDHRMFAMSDNGDAISLSERSCSGFSFSSHSTVKQSNTTTTSTSRNRSNISTGEGRRKTSFQNRHVQTGTSHSNYDENRLQLEQNNGVPMITQSFSSDDGEDLRASLAMEPRQFSSVANYTIQEDDEVVPSTLPPYYPSLTSTTSLRSTSTGISADPPPQIDQARLRHLHGHGDDGIQSVLSSYSSGVSSGILSDAAVYGEDYISSKNDIPTNDKTNDPPSDPPEDDRIDVEQPVISPVQNDAQKARKVSPCLIRSVIVGVIVLSVVIVLVVLAFGGNKKTVPQLSDLTTVPPSSKDTEFNEDGSVVAPPSGSEGALETSSRLIAEMRGEPFDMIGRKVAVGGPTGSTLVGMLHDGFVRVERLGIDGETLWTTVGSDIPVKGGAQIAISSNASRLAIVDNFMVTVRQLTSSGQDDEIGQWETLDTIGVVNQEGQNIEGNVLSSSVSISSSGKYLAHATIFTSPRGAVLSIARQTVRKKDAEESEEANDSTVAMSEILDFDDHSDFVKVSISVTGDRLSACTRNKLMVLDTRDGKLSDFGIQPILPFGSIINDCDFASDGLTIAASLIDASATILFSLRNGVWEQTDDVLPFSGNSIALSPDSGVAVVADSSLEHGVVTVWKKESKSKSEDGYRLIDTLLGTSGSSDFGVSLAFSRRLDFDEANEDVLVVGAPGGAQKEGAVHVYRL